MTLIDELLKADSKKATELKTKSIPSARLTAILGKDEMVNITIQELKSRRINDLMSLQYDRKGNVDHSKNYDMNLLIATEAIIEPDLKDKKLQEHFGADTAKDLCEKLFAGEVFTIAGEVVNLIGLVAENNEEEIKN